MQVLARLNDPHLLICETCLSTGARISEVLGLTLKHIDLRKGTIYIEQRHCRGDIDVPKTRNSRRVLTLGSLALFWLLTPVFWFCTICLIGRSVGGLPFQPEADLHGYLKLLHLPFFN